MLALIVGVDESVASTPTPCFAIVLPVTDAGDVPAIWMPTDPFSSTMLCVKLPVDAPSKVMPTVVLPENVESRSRGAVLSPACTPISLPCTVVSVTEPRELAT